MHIKSIVLDGFKSYGHRTEITGFDKQFNAITGLNGSGKSNILDAICFVLGISNLTQVRAASFQDLIYKCGQCGINKATVSVTFDNRNPEQSPPGFEDASEITITRQIVMGKKTKYMINGTTVPNKNVQDLFCSIQLNVNNPHFLIMQGRITKVLNMKPHDILAMVEEAAGAKMYEIKKQAAKGTIEKKDAKLSEFVTIFNEELSPRLEKLRAERAQYMQYKIIEQELDNLLRLFQAWEFVAAQRKMLEAQKIYEDQESQKKEDETQIINSRNEIATINVAIEEALKQAKSDDSENLSKAEAELKQVVKAQAKVNATVKSFKDNITNEVKKKKELEKNVVDDEKTLKFKETELNKVKSLFETLKENDERDNQALALLEKRYQALLSGMEINEQGEAETLLQQVMKAREEASKANTEVKQAKMELNYCQTQLKQKETKRVSNIDEVQRDQQTLDNMNVQIRDLKAGMAKLQFDEGRMNELQQHHRQLTSDMQNLQEQIDIFEARRPNTQFRYTDPEKNFDRSCVIGVVCRLIKVKNDFAAIAIEKAAGQRLYDVVVDSHVTGKKLLQRGNLQKRTNFIPMDKIQAHRMKNECVMAAQRLVGSENVQPALAHLEYDHNLQRVMEFVFGNVLICKDLNTATKVAFHEQVRKRCVTLDGDVVDPAGILSGGAPEAGGSTLKQLAQIQECEKQCRKKERDLRKIESELETMRTKRDRYMEMKRELEIGQDKVKCFEDRLKLTDNSRAEIAKLKNDIEELEKKIKSRNADEARLNDKVQELERKLKNSEGGKEKQIEEAAKEMKKLKIKADKSRDQWKQKEQDYETFILEISELQKGLENTKLQIQTTEEKIRELEEKLEEVVANSKELQETHAKLQAEVKQKENEISKKNKDVQKKHHRIEELQAQIAEYEIKIKEHDIKLKKLKEDMKMLQTKQKDLKKRVKESSLKEAEKLTDAEGQQLEKRIRKLQENKNTMGRTVNDKAQMLFEQQEKEFNDLKRKQKIVQHDKKTLLQVIRDLDKKKEEVLTKAYDQISSDFGSIFSTLLPGANAKLVPPTGQTILQGLEVKVSLGGIWTESLTELSGGQRSLAALSLILAMLLFKPAPLYILDEVDAALDLSHTQNIGNMLKTHFKKSQFIIVSLKDGMFNNANVLFKTQFIDGVSTVTRRVNQQA